MDTGLPSQPETERRYFPTLWTALDLAADLPGWLSKAVIVLAILGVSIAYLWPSPLEFPMDDTYIHFVYAENLSEHGKLFFNDPSEKGVGSSSLLWVLILAAGNWAGLSMHWVAKLAGLISLVALGIGLYHLLRPLMAAWVALACALLVVLSGHMLWFALSGMETVLFLALGILALLCYREKRWVWMGVVLGLLVITRVEGILLILVIVGVDIWRCRSVRPGLVISGAVSAMIFLPWFLFLWLRTGYFLPTSGIGRHFSNITAIQIATEHIASLAWLSRFPALAYPLTWMGYSIEFILGGFALPGPYFQINLGIGSFSYRLSVWAILGLLTLVLPLLWISFRRLLIHLKKTGWKEDKAPLPLLIFLIWMILHNIGYMIYLPIIGSASRYASLNHIALWLALGLSLWFARKSIFVLWLAAGLTMIALANTIYWNRVYDANLEHMLKVRIAAADYIREQIPESETCAAFDVGALRYYIDRPLIDLGGLIDPGVFQYFTAGESDEYLVENGVGCLVVPGRRGSTTDGVIDIAKESGLSESNFYELQPVKFFQIDQERWLLGYLPTVNYQATVTIYQLAGMEATSHRLSKPPTLNP